MLTEPFRVGFSNLPSHTEKRALVLPKFRAPRMMRWAKDQNISVLGVAEFATISRLYVKGLPGWRSWDAKYNNDFGKNEIGNTLVWRHNEWEFVRAHTLHVDAPGRPRGMNAAVVLLEHISTGQRFWFIVWHAPRKKTEPYANDAVYKAVVREMKRLFKIYGFPVISMGDANDKVAADMRLEEPIIYDDGTANALVRTRIAIGVAVEVLVIASYGADWHGEQRVDTVKFSDHPGVSRLVSKEAQQS